MLTNWRNFLTAKTPSPDVPKPKPVAVNAGAEILSHYQQQWSELHNINESNATNAGVIAEEINKLHSKIVDDHNNIAQILQVLANSPSLRDGIENCVVKLSNLHESFEKVERELFTLEDLIEKVELEQKKADHRYQLVLYKEKKLVGLESTRTNLAGKYAQNVISHEVKQKRMLTERQQVFADAFNKDLEAFKSIGEIPKIQVRTTQPSALLEEIQLDCDNKELDQFLEET